MTWPTQMLRRSRGVQSPRSSLQDLEHSCRLLFAVCAVCFVVLTWVIHWRSFSTDGWEVVGVVALSAGCIALGVLTLRRGFLRSVGVAVTAVTVCGWALAMWWGHAQPTGQVWWPVQLMPIVFAYVMVSIGSWSGLVCTAAMALATAVGSSAAARIPLVVAMTQTLGPWAFAVAAVQVLRLVQHASEVNATSHNAWCASAEAEALSAGREEQAQWVDHLLHDEVVHALRAISLSDRLNETEVIASAERALRSLALPDSQPGISVSLKGQMEQLTTRAGIQVRCDLQQVYVPDEVRETLVAATREAVRNAALHSSAGVVDVMLRRQRRGAQVVIRDGGSGFDPADVPAGHFGIRHGIAARMAHVGGEATIDSGPSGTTVTLTWQPSTGRDPERWVELSRVRAAAVLASAPFALLYLFIAVTNVAETDLPVLAAVGSFLVLGAWCVCAAVFARRRLRTTEALLVGGVGVATQLLGWLALGPMSANPDHYWLASAPIVLTAFAFVGRRLMAALILAAAMAIVPALLVWTHGGMNRLLLLGPAVVVPIGGSVLVLVLVLVGRRIGSRLADEQQQSVESIARKVETDLRQLILAERIGDLRDRITPLLRMVATGEVDAQSPSVRDDASVLEAWVRDSISGSQARWPAQLADVVETLRRQRCSVTMSQAVPMNEQQLDWVDNGLRRLVHVSGLDRVSVACLPGAKGGRLTVTVAPYRDDLVRTWGTDPRMPVQTDMASFVSWLYLTPRELVPVQRSAVAAVLESRDVRGDRLDDAIVP